MGVLGYIQKAKSKFNEQKTRIRKIKTTRQTSRIKSLKKERMFQEKSAGLRLTEKRERDRIAKAKGIQSDGGFMGRSGSLAERLSGAGTLKGKSKLVKKGSVLDKSNPYQLGSGGANWSNVGAPTMKKGKKKNLWG